MAPSLGGVASGWTCENCGTTVGVAAVRVNDGRRDRVKHLCASCKATLLERTRVRVRKGGRPRRRVPLPTGRLGTALLVVGVMLLLLIGALVGSRMFGGDDERECYPGAGFTCETPVG